MVDWAGLAGQSTERRYRGMAERQLRGISPSYERLCLGVADDLEVIARLDTLPPPKRQPNLLLAAVRFLGGDQSMDSYAAFRTFVLDRWGELSATMLARRTQTNEPRRCATLLPVLAAVPQPVALLEVGASAGLCLYPDRYAYRYTAAGDMGDEHTVLGDSELVLDCRVTGRPAADTALVDVAPRRLPSVAWRVGLDVNPLDVDDEQDVRWLRSLIWPEETERFAILDRAVAIARRERARIVRGDLLTDVKAMAADAPADATLVIFHSAVLAYVAEEQRGAFVDAVRQVAAQRPTVWLSNEGPRVVVDVPVPAGSIPFVLARDGVALATTSPHGDWLAWLP
jgi:hypothetical protein